MCRMCEENKAIDRAHAKWLKEYVEAYGFETELDVAPWQHSDGVVTPLKTFKAIAVNLGHTNSKVFDSVWKKECDECGGKGDWYSHHYKKPPIHYVCVLCNGIGYIKPYDLMIAFCRRPGHKWNVSIYSTKLNIDCDAIAKSFGGYGTKEEAGFQCETLPFDY